MEPGNHKIGQIGASDNYGIFLSGEEILSRRFVSYQKSYTFYQYFWRRETEKRHGKMLIFERRGKKSLPLNIEGKKVGLIKIEEEVVGKKIVFRDFVGKRKEVSCCYVKFNKAVKIILLL